MRAWRENAPHTLADGSAVVERGRDGANLARIRERLADREAELAEMAQQTIDDQERDRRALVAVDAEIAAIEEAARHQEQRNASEITHLLLTQVAVGTGAFVLGTLLRVALEHLSKATTCSR